MSAKRISDNRRMTKKSAVAAPAKPAPRKRAPRAKKPLDQDVQQEFLTLDYPQQGEGVTSASYTIRLTLPENTPYAEVSFDGGEWRACRFAVGHWWYDWSDYASGTYTLRARAVTPEGREVVIERRCDVVL